MWKYVLLTLFILPEVIIAQYSRVEYFIDTDPGYGMATVVSSPQNDKCDFVVDLNAISSGFHILYIRVKDENGIWSQTVSRPFIKMALAKDELPIFVKAEYFIDIDPSYGEATAITDKLGDSLMFNAELSTIVEGFHILYVRTLDSRGMWSQTMNRPFIKSSFQSGVFPNIVDAEYFIDSIGEYGMGIPIQITNPTSNVSVSFMIELNGINLGNHIMYVRAKDSHGAWGMIQSIGFNVCPLIQTEESQVICKGSTYQFGSQLLTQSGEYTEVFTTASGCDSVVILSLNAIKIDTTVLVSENILSSNEVDAEYQWLDCNIGNTPIAGAINKTYTPLINGNYTVKISKNGCTEISNCIPFALTGITNAGKYGKPLKLYPNPSKGEFTVELVNPMLIEIYNPMGVLVLSKQYAIGNHIISLQNIVDGMYLIVAKDKQDVLYEKLQIIKK